MLKQDEAVSPGVSTTDPVSHSAGPAHYTFGGGPMNSWWGILGWWGLFRDGRDPRLVAFGRSQIKGFGVVRDWVDPIPDVDAQGGRS